MLNIFAFLEMKRQLYYLFTTYGRVTELILLPGMRGQAYVVLQEPAMALHALKSINEFTFFGKPLVTSTVPCILSSSFHRKFNLHIEKVKRWLNATTTPTTVLNEGSPALSWTTLSAMTKNDASVGSKSTSRSPLCLERASSGC